MMTDRTGEIRDCLGDLWPSERERDIFNRGYAKALEDAAMVAEKMPRVEQAWPNDRPAYANEAAQAIRALGKR